MTFNGTTNTFAQASINSDAWGPLKLIDNTAATKTLALTDAGKVIMNRTTSGDYTLTIPLDSAVNFPVGSVVEMVQTSVAGSFYIKGNAGVTLNYNSTLGAGSDGSLGGGPGAQVRLRGPMTSGRIMKQGANSWVIFGDLITI
jgi:hypothetical protein